MSVCLPDEMCHNQIRIKLRPLTCSSPIRLALCRWACPLPPLQNLSHAPAGRRRHTRTHVPLSTKCDSMSVKAHSLVHMLQMSECKKCTHVLIVSAYHACDDAPLLVVLAPEHRHVRIYYIQQLCHNLCVWDGAFE